MSRFISTHAFTLKKTVSYYFTHVTVAAGVAYVVTGDWLAAVTLSLLEPTVQAMVYFFHERIWSQRQARTAKANGVNAPSISASTHQGAC